MATNFLEALEGLDLGRGLNSAKPLANLRELATMETAGERDANRLEGLSNQLQPSNPLLAVIKGVTQGVAGEKRSKAEQERAEKIAAIEAQTQYQQQQAAWLDEVKAKLENSKLAELERLQNQAGIDEGLRLAVDFGDGTAIAEIVRANPGMQGVLDDTLPDGVKFEGVNFDKQNGTLVPFGRDADGNVLYGQGQKWERFASPEFMQQRANALYEQQKQADTLALGDARIATERAQGNAANALAEQRRMPDAPPTPSSVSTSGGLTVTAAPTPKLTEDQGKNVGFATRMTGALSTLDSLEGTSDFDPANLRETATSAVPGGNFLVSDNFQKYRQAQSEFLAGILRGDTGAAITKEEFAMYGPMYFPQPGDGAEVRAQKADARRRALQGTMARTGPGAALVPGASSTTPGVSKQSMKDKYGLK